jgi:hypothetical protein
MRKSMLNLALVVFALAAIAIALPALAGADDTTVEPTAPPHFYEKTYRVGVNLQDVSGTVYSATLTDLPSSVPWQAQQWITYNLDSSTFDVESKGAKCFVVSTKTEAAPCSRIATMVDEAADGGVEVYALVQPVDGGADGLSFNAKKITVWIDGSGTDAQPPADDGSPGGDVTPPPVPAKFYSKNIRLNVNLQDSDTGPVFDAVLNEIPASVPGSFRAYLEAVLDSSTFEVDASHATCFVVRRGVQNQVPCATVVSWLDQSADGGIDATILARAVKGTDLSYAAKKITIWL